MKDDDPFENRMTDAFREAFWLRMGRPDIAERFRHEPIN